MKRCHKAADFIRSTPGYKLVNSQRLPLPLHRMCCRRRDASSQYPAARLGFRVEQFGLRSLYTVNSHGLRRSCSSVDERDQSPAPRNPDKQYCSAVTARLLASNTVLPTGNMLGRDGGDAYMTCMRRLFRSHCRFSLAGQEA